MRIPTRNNGMLFSKLFFKNTLYVLCVFLLPVLIFISASFAANAYTNSASKTKGLGVIRVFHFEEFAATDSDVELASEIHGRMTHTGVGLDDGSELREVLAEKLDPLFLIGTLFGEGVREAWYLSAYLIRIGLAALTMAFLCRKHICCNKLMTIVLSCAYALCAPVLSFSMNSALMNACIILPLVVCCLDRFFRDSRTFNGILIIISTAVLFISGPYGVIFGLPFIALMSIMLVLCMRVDKTQSIIMYLKSIPFTLIGLALSSVSIVQWILAKEVTLTFNAIKDNLVVKYTLFDFLSKMMDGFGYSTKADSGNIAPVFGLSIFVFILFIIFIFNSKVPIRIRISILAIILLYHLSIAFTPLEMVTDPYYLGDGFGAARLCFLAVMIFFFAAVSMKNIKKISDGTLYAVGFLTIILLILSNSSAIDIAPSEFSLYFSGLGGIVVVALLIFYNRSEGILPSILITVAVIIGLGINLSYCLSVSQVDTQTITRMSVFQPDVEDATTAYGYDIISSGEHQFSIASQDVGKIDYIVLPYSISADNHQAFGTPVDLLNYLSRSTNMDTPIFSIKNSTPAFVRSQISTTFPSVGDEILLVNDYVEGQEVYAMSNFRGRSTFTTFLDDTELHQEFNVPFLVEAEPQENAVNSVRLFYGENVEYNVMFLLYSMDEEALDALNSKTLSSGTSLFSLDTSGIPPVVDNVISVVVGSRYSDLIDVEVNSEEVPTFSIGGFLAFELEYDGTGDMKVCVGRDNKDIIVGVIISSASLAGVCLLYYYGKKTMRNREEVPL